MALVLADRVRETTTTTGTGTITLAGAAVGFQSFAAIGNGNTTYYTISGGSQWEVGIGTYTSSGTTLSRNTVLASSNSGSLVNFSAGTKDVFVTYPAEKSINQDANGVVADMQMQGYRETVTTVTPSGGTATLDLALGNVFTVTLTSASTALAFSNPPSSGVSFSITLIVKQDATGNRVLTYPASCKFTDSVAPVLATGANKTDVITFFTVDGGTTYFGGQALANLG